MKKRNILLYLFIFLIISLFINLLSSSKYNLFVAYAPEDESLVSVKAFVNSECDKCTQVEEYLKVYKKAGVKFSKIYFKKYGSGEYEAHQGEYDIKRLPFIVFGKNLENYKTISSSWKRTFGYKNTNGEYIPTDIIPPYFDINTNKIVGLIDAKYIQNNNCTDCYLFKDVLEILKSFGLRFNEINLLDEKSEEAVELIKSYNIKKLPTLILSANMKKYENFSYFWKGIGTVEKDGVYILRNSINLGLKNN